MGLSFDKKTGESVNHVSLMRATLAAHVAILLGWFAHEAITGMGLLLPLFCTLLADGDRDVKHGALLVQITFVACGQ